jgi:hypothetical protein
MIDKSFIETIVELRDEGIIQEIDGINFSPAKLNPVFFEPRPKPLRIGTLTGLVDYLKTNVDGLDATGLLLIINGPENIALLSEVNGVDRRRDELAEVILDSNLKSFPFGQFLGTEDFVIKLRSLFQASSDLNRVIGYTSKVKSGTEIITEDDGITQIASVKRGASGAVLDTLPAPVTVSLKPFRTFRELDQVASEFLFRMIPGGGEKATTFALFEADGGAWRNQAVLDIKAYLEEKDLGIAIIA